MGAVKSWMMEQAEKEQGMMPCPECWGDGKVEVEYAVPHNINRDVGYLDTRLEDCDYCGGSGSIENEGFEDVEHFTAWHEESDDV